MKIALVSPYDFAYPGGVVRHITCLDHHFTAIGHDVRIIAPASHPVTEFGDRFITIGKPRAVPTSGSIARITISLNLTSKVKEVMEAKKFDIIHLHEPLAPTLCTTVLRASNTVNVGTFHAYGSKPSYRWSIPFVKFYLKKWFRKLDGKIAVSKPAMEYARKHFPGSYTVIPNGIDLTYFSPKTKPLEQYNDGMKNIVFVGRLEKRKGVKYLIKAFKQVKAEVPNSRLIIVGPGVRLRNQYEKEVEKSDLQDVVFTGGVPYDDLPRYYQTADVFCAPALGYESFGIVLLEAMATGKPVVATSIEGYSDVMSDGVEGLLVPPKDDRSLAKALVTFLKDEAACKEMGQRGIARASMYSWENVAHRIMEFYLMTLTKNSS